MHPQKRPVNTQKRYFVTKGVLYTLLFANSIHKITLFDDDDGDGSRVCTQKRRVYPQKRHRYTQKRLIRTQKTDAR